MSVRVKKLTTNNINWIANLSEESQRNVQLKLELMSKIIDLKQRIEMLQFAIDNNKNCQDSIRYIEKVMLETTSQLKITESLLADTKKLIQNQYDLIDQLNKAKTFLFE